MRTVGTPQKDDCVEHLTEEVQNLSHRLQAPCPGFDEGMYPNERAHQGQLDQRRTDSIPGYTRHCWFCKRTNGHPFGICNCPLCIQLIKEDRARIPNVPLDSSESVEQVLRHLFAPKRESPLHQGQLSSTALLEPQAEVGSSSGDPNRRSVLRLLHGGGTPLQGVGQTCHFFEASSSRFEEGVAGNPPTPISSLEELASKKVAGLARLLCGVGKYANPTEGVPPPRNSLSVLEADHTGKRNVWFNPMAHSEPRVSRSPSQGTPYIDIPPHPKLSTIMKLGQPPHTPITKDKENAPAPSTNTRPPEPLMEKGRLNNTPDKDIEMVEPPAKQKMSEHRSTSRLPPKMQFTTNLHLGGSITKSITCGDPSGSDYYSDNEQELETSWGDTSYGSLCRLTDVGKLKHILDKSLYAMGTGRQKVKIGSREDLNCMIDTGSELNLISRRLQESLGLPYDPAGSAWGIRGVNSNAEPLYSCCRTVPIEIGGLRFDHIFFVKNGSIGVDYDLLMGQPWLKAIAAEIRYHDTSKSNNMHLQIYEQGDVTGESLIINLAVDQRREATKLTHITEWDLDTSNIPKLLGTATHVPQTLKPQTSTQHSDSETVAILGDNEMDFEYTCAPKEVDHSTAKPIPPHLTDPLRSLSETMERMAISGKSGASFNGQSYLK
ncbi:hypothetical protein BS47DRAFT_1362344 [Hydnum rufescens UP504]|uniref:Uncharacterized protein n=1 Tax=Hydnum rufescens UP504 TaxID=1448309 RepID=A0A9P6AXQ5_9AGAM|nr:hypothetical protein BS47DRAFT_1362344 [Hydnum rufescens UP504]